MTLKLNFLILLNFCTLLILAQSNSSIIPCDELYYWNITVDKIQPNCGINDGSILVSDFFESRLLSYEWEHGANGLQLDNLRAGIYTISGIFKVKIATDFIKCSFKKEIILDDNDSADLTTTVLNKQSCAGIEDGMAEVMVSNANGNYDIEWFNGVTTALVSNLTVGNYRVKVTDEQNCQAFNSVFVDMNSALISKATVFGTPCNTGNGAVHLNIEGGSGIYTVDWLDGNTLPNRTNLAAGNYLAVITDEDGCTIEKNITINDDCNGKINCEDDYIDVNNEYGAYMFQFANDIDPFDGEITSFEISQPQHALVDPLSQSKIGKKINKNEMHMYYFGDKTFVGLDSFRYTVCTSAGFCDSATVYINVVSKPVVRLENTHADTLQIFLGDEIKLTANGARNYSWSPPTALCLTKSSWTKASPTETTTYTIIGINENGQTDTYEFTIEVIKPNFEAFEDAIQIHQDINNNKVYLKGQLQQVDITLLDAANNAMSNLSTLNNSLTINLSGFDKGLYYLHIQHKDYPDVSSTTILKD